MRDSGGGGAALQAGGSCFAPAGSAVVTLHEGMNSMHLWLLFFCHRSWQPTQGPCFLLGTQHPVMLDRNSGCK